MKVGIVVAFAASALALGSPAEAKGISGAMITGAGLERPIVLDPRINGSALERFMVAAPSLVGEGSGSHVARPADLGPRLRLTWTIHWRITQYVIQDVYPYAPRGPVFHTPGGQPVFDQWTVAEWYRAGPAALAALQSFGLPPAYELRADQSTLDIARIPTVEARTIQRW